MYNFESQWRFLLFELFTFISNSLKKNKSHKSQILSNYNAHWRWKNIKVSSRRQINKIIISGLCLVLNYSWRKLEVVKVILKYPIWQKSIDMQLFFLFLWNLFIVILKIIDFFTEGEIAWLKLMRSWKIFPMK